LGERRSRSFVRQRRTQDFSSRLKRRENASTSGPAFQTAPPRKRKETLEKEEGDTEMFTGTTIEELIKSVVRAEQHAREQREPKYEFRDLPVRRMSVEELEVA